MSSSEKPLVIVCDDEELIRWSLCAHLDQEGFRTQAVENGQQCVDAVRSHAPAVVVMDLKMPVMDGLTALAELRRRGDEVPVIIMTAHGAVDSAIEATRLGAAAYLQKPFDLREMTFAIGRTLEKDRLQREVHYLRRRSVAGYGEFIGRSSSLDPLFRVLERLEKVDAPTVLITGESGTGKDVVAREIHRRGIRKDGIFVDIDCAALPETLIESELFGHERGAFTDARQQKRGLLEVAEGGVAFLDEIGEMTLATQAKLLRAIEGRSFKRVGGVAPIKMDVALVTATNRDLKAEVTAGRFREDLYFRLHVVPVHIPPLRDRREDVPLLVESFLERFSRQLGRAIDGVSGDAMARLQEYRWPGNVRELRNLMERLVILAPGPVLSLDDLPPEVRFGQPGAQAPFADGDFRLPEDGCDLDAVERSLLSQALERTQGNQSASARLLGISRYALRYRMEKHGLM